MSETAKRDAVLREFMPCGGHVCKGCEVQCINVDGRTPSVAWMADEIVRLRQRADRAERILAALREPSDAVVNVAWEHMDIIRAAVAAAEREVDA